MRYDPIAYAQHRVTRSYPCPVCGKDHGLCALFPSREQVEEVLCQRVPSPIWIEKIQCWKHRLTTEPTSWSTTLSAAPVKAVTVAPVDVRNKVYQRARELAEPLCHRRHYPLFTCPKRGMSVSQVKARGYFLWATIADRYVEGYRRQGDGRTLLAARLLVEEGSKVYGVPGFGENKRDRFSALGWSGVFVPALDPAGNIVGGQVATSQADQGKGAPKYATLRGGSIPLHCSRPTGYGSAPVRESRRVWLTEGLLKADIASDLLGEVVLGSAGQKFGPQLEEYLAALDPVEVVVALDYDPAGTAAAANTERARRTLADRVLALGYRVSIAVWDQDEGKGLDDLLLANGSPTLREYVDPSRRRPEYLGQLVAPQQSEHRPQVSLEDQREQLRDALRGYLANRTGTAADEVLLLRHAPGVGKTTIFTDVAREYVDHDNTRSLIHVVPTHQVGHDLGYRGGWDQIYGRESDKAPQGKPCHRSEQYRALAERGASRSSICKMCPLVNACSSRQRDADQPYHLSQFRRRQLTRMPAAYLHSPDLLSKCGTGPLVIDDVDLDQLSLSPLWITESDLEKTLVYARGEEDPEEGAPPGLRPAVPLLEILRDYRRHVVDQLVGDALAPSGAELVLGLSAWCAATERNLPAAVESALLANERDPLLDVTDFDRLDPSRLGPRHIVRDLADVLAVEIEHAREGRTAWNSRVSLGRPPGRNSRSHGISWLVTRHRALPMEAYSSRPIVVLNASMTREQAERLFPGRTIRVLEPVAPLPESVTVTQYLDIRYGKTALSYADTQDQAREEIRQIMERHAGQKVGVITHKSFADVLREDPEFQGLTVMHFFGHRSLNTAADVNAWIVLGTPHPREADIVRATQAVHWRDSLPIDPTISPRPATIHDRDGRPYAVQRRTALDSRLREQMEQATLLELEQALLRCRPHNVTSPQQGDLLRGYGRGRTSVAIYAFTPEPLPISPHRVETRASRKPEQVDQLVEAARRIVAEGKAKPSERDLEAAVGIPRRQVRRVLSWLRLEYGEAWLDNLEAAQAVPRPEQGQGREEQTLDVLVAPGKPESASRSTTRPVHWSTTDLVDVRRQPPKPPPPKDTSRAPSVEEIRAALDLVI